MKRFISFWVSRTLNRQVVIDDLRSVLFDLWIAMIFALKKFLFQAPVPVRRWNGVKDATKYGRACPQLGITDKLNETELSMGDLEDCLSLAIYTKDVIAMKSER